MLKSCPYCQKIHDSKYDCGKKPQKRNRRTEKDRFRYTAAWQQKRDAIKERVRSVYADYTAQSGSSTARTLAYTMRTS